MAQNLISRSQWGARYRDGFRDRPMPITEYWLHHSVTIAPDLLPPFDDDDRAIRTLENIGQQRFGGGISYTYPVTPVGRIYQGVSLHRQGAHTKGHNTAGAAFVLVGDYSTRRPTAAQEYAIAYRMVLDHRAGDSTTHQLTGGHRDVFGTSCPGGAAYGRIPAINKLARDLWVGVAGSGGGGTTGPTGGGSGGGTTYQEDDMELTDKIHLTETEKRVWDVTELTAEDAFKSAVYARRFANEAKKDAAVARALIEAVARKTLTADEITAAIEAGVAAAIRDSYDAVLVPKETP